jgi:hypothetical protein
MRLRTPPERFEAKLQGISLTFRNGFEIFESVTDMERNFDQKRFETIQKRFHRNYARSS